MNETQIKCFITAARSASFSEAAEKLFMTPPTFGRHISSLEKELGHPLFVRGWKGLRLTPVGQLMYDGFLEIGDKLDELKAEAERISSGAAGQLNIAILDGQHFDSHLRDVSLYLRRAYPDLQVQLTRGSFREIEEQLLNGKLDLGVTITEEIEQVVSFVKQSGEAQYDDDVIAKIEASIQEKDKGSGAKGGSASADSGDEEGDELLPAAVDVILETGQASVSMLQRRLKLGYSRAARLVDQMEERGIVGPFEGSKPRQLLITRAQWQEMQMGSSGGGEGAASDLSETSQMPEE